MSVWDDVDVLVARWLDDVGETQGEDSDLSRLDRIEASLLRVERVLGQLARIPNQSPNVRETVTMTYSRESKPRVQVPEGIQGLNSEVQSHPLFLRMKELVERGGD